MASNWLWDVAHISHFQGTGILINGAWSVPAVLVYHLAWYSSIASFLTLVFYCHHLIEKLKAS